MNQEYLVEQLTTLKKEGRVSIDLKEAAVPTGSAFGKGGEYGYLDTGFSLRYTNPLRLGTLRQEQEGATAARWVYKKGDATVNNSSTGPWGDLVSFNAGNVDTSFWSLPMRTVAATVPVRQAVWDDLPNGAPAIVGDILYELSQREAESSCQNLDNNALGTVQTATGSTNPVAYGNGFVITLNIPTTTGFVVGQFAGVAGATAPLAWNGFYRVTALTTNASVTLFYPANPGNYSAGTVTVQAAGTAGYGAQSGLRGLDSYASAAPNAGGFIWGASGESVGNDNIGRHSIVTVPQLSGTVIAYNDVLNVATNLPGQFWGLATTCWHISQSKINEIRTLKDSNGLPLFLDTGIPRESGAAVSIMGWPVIVNPYLSTKFPMYLVNSMSALSFVDHNIVDLQIFEQSLPGSQTIYVQKRLAFSLADPAAIVRLQVGS